MSSSATTPEEYVVVRFDYAAREPHELSIRKDEKLRLISDTCNWWKVTNERGQVGFVPSNYVRRQSFADKARETFRALGRSRSKSSLNARDSSSPSHHFQESLPETSVFPVGGDSTAASVPSSGPTSILKKTANHHVLNRRERDKMPDVISYAIAKFNYEPQRDDELRLSKGDHLSVLDKSADGWWRGEMNGSTGWFPSNYVDETNMPPPSVAAAAAPPPTNGSSGFAPSAQSYSATAAGYGNGVTNFSTQPTSFAASSEVGSHERVLEVAIALYSFDAQNAEELSFRKGERLEIIDHPAHDPDWYKARNASGAVGLVPNNYVEIVERNPPAGGAVAAGFSSAASKFPNTSVLTGPYANEPWYFGPLSREQSDSLLNARGIEGDYLVRDSESNPGDYSISLKGNIRNKHFWVQIDTSSGTYKIGNRTFPSMQQLIQHYTKSPIFSNDQTGERLYLVRPLPR